MVRSTSPPPVFLFGNRSELDDDPTKFGFDADDPFVRAQENYGMSDTPDRYRMPVRTHVLHL
jgi:hypothetical protein